MRFRQTILRLGLGVTIWIGLFSAVAWAATIEATLVVEGIVYDFDSRQPIPFTTIRVVGSDRSALANGEGRFRLRLGPDERELKFSHIAYFSELLAVGSADSIFVTDIYLHPGLIDVGGLRVYGREYDPGQRIILEAIQRKEDILTKIHDYQCDAYTKLLVFDESKPDSSEIMMITETQTTAFWEQPNQFKQIIRSRRQSANIDAEGNLVTIGNILNFNKNRIELGRYSIVSPTAEDALDHYNYYLLDTLYLDSMPVFRLEIEPKNPDDPLFVGFIHIADSTYDVVEVDVGFSRGVDFSVMKDLRYSQRFAQFENEYWMPIEIRFSASIELKIPLPGIPDKIGFAHVASLHEYQFDAGHADDTFGEYLVEVDYSADEIDTSAWQARQTIPLTTRELDAYHRIDSIKQLPPSIGKIATIGVAVAAYLLLVGEEDIFRFNRVEGPYLGLGGQQSLLNNRLKIRRKFGYAFDAKRSQHHLGATYRLHSKRKLDLSFDYVNRITRRPTIISGPRYNPSFSAILNWVDPLDYYRIKGFRAATTFKLLNQTRLELGYNDFQHWSMPVITDYSFVDGEGDRPRANPMVTEGQLRSVSAEFRYDSRKMFNNKGEDIRIDEPQYLTVTAGIEYASPQFVSNDFDFRRYSVDIRRTQRSFGMGVTKMRLYAGGSDGNLPPQKQFTIDFSDPFAFAESGFFTLDRNNFGGSRVLVLAARHNFRRRLFVASGIPLVKDIPLWLSVHGGAFWTDFKNHTLVDGDEAVRLAGKPYRELGFGLGNLTPFLMPLNLTLNFSWQLSDYDTSGFAVTFDIKL